MFLIVGIFLVFLFSLQVSASDQETSLSIFDDSDFGDIYVNEPNVFYANYIADHNGQIIPNALCEISFDMGSGYGGMLAFMTYDSSLELYTYTDVFSNVGVFDFKVVCNNFHYNLAEEIDEFEISEAGDEDADLEIWDDSDFGNVYEGEDINFYADYTDADTGLPIDTGSCRIVFDSGFGYVNLFNMVYDSGLGLFVYETSFPNAGDYNFKVGCSDLVYETLSASDEFEILEEGCGEEICGGDSDFDYVGYCTPDWECGDWSSCHNGMKFRECVDLNECEFAYNEPLERIGCHESVEKKVLEIEEGYNWLLWLLVGLAVLLILILVVLSLRGN